MKRITVERDTLLAFRRRWTAPTREIRDLTWFERPPKWPRGAKRSLVVKLGDRSLELRSQLSLREAIGVTEDAWPAIQDLQRIGRRDRLH